MKSEFIFAGILILLGANSITTGNWPMALIYLGLVIIFALIMRKRTA